MSVGHKRDYKVWRERELNVDVCLCYSRCM